MARSLTYNTSMINGKKNYSDSHVFKGFLCFYFLWSVIPYDQFFSQWIKLLCTYRTIFLWFFFLLTDKPLVIAGKQSISTIWLLDGFRKIAGMNLKFRKWYYSELNEIFKKASPRHLFNYKPLVKYVFIKNSEYKMGKWDP